MADRLEGMTFGLIVGNRGFFPDHLAASGRREMMAAIEASGARVVVLGPADSKHGAVETREESATCAALFKAHRETIDGIIVTLPNFGEERGIADALRMAGLDVPVLIQATPDTPSKLTIADRRDSFCGKMSLCNNLTQYGIPYSLTSLHTEAPDSEAFRRDLGAVCGRLPGGQGPARAARRRHRRAAGRLQHRAVQREDPRGQRHLRRDGRPLGDPRPGRPAQGRRDPAVTAKLEAIKAYMPTGATPAAALLKMAKLGGRHRTVDEGNRGRRQRRAVLDGHRGVLRHRPLRGDEHDERQPAVQRLRGGRLRRRRDARAAARLRHAVARCSTGTTTTATTRTRPSASTAATCRSTSSRTAGWTTRRSSPARSARRTPSARAWGGSRRARSPSRASRRTTSQVTRLRVRRRRARSPTIRSRRSAARASCYIPEMQELLRFICENGFEHHVAANLSSVADIVHEATTRYLGWDIYRH